MGGPGSVIISKLTFGGLPKFILGLSGLCFCIGLLLGAHSLYLKSKLNTISSEYKEAEKLKKEIGLMYQEKDRLAKRMELLGGHLKRDVIWSVKLRQLRSLIPQEVWLKKLTFEQKSLKPQDYSLSLSGALVPGPDANAIASLSNFMSRLKGDKDFFAGFDNPVLSDVRSETKEGVEVMSFIIEMPLAKGSAK